MTEGEAICLRLTNREMVAAGRWNRPGKSCSGTPDRGRKSRSRRLGFTRRLLALIDVLFTLMLFFVIAARTKLAEGEIPGSLPKMQPPDVIGIVGEKDPITITVRPLGDGANNCRYELDGQATSDAGKLYERLCSRPALYGAGTLENVPVLIRPVQGVRWRWAVEAYNQALRAGYHKVEFQAKLF